MEEQMKLAVYQAIRLKDLGFPQDLPQYVTVEGSNRVRQVIVNMYREDDTVCYAPFLDTVNKWLREEKNMCVHVSPRVIGVINGWEKCTVTYDGWVYNICHFPKHEYTPKFSIPKVYPTYETAMCAGINEAIELLESKKEEEKEQ